MPATMWYRMVAGLNAQLRTVRRGWLRRSLLPVINWLNTHVNPWISIQGLRADLAWFQATSSGYFQLGLVLSAESEEVVPYSLHHYDLRSLTRSSGRWGDQSAFFFFFFFLHLTFLCNCCCFIVNGKCSGSRFICIDKKLVDSVDDETAVHAMD